MTYKQFREAVTKLYEEDNVTFRRNEALYQANIGMVTLQSSPYNERIKIFFHGNFAGFLEEVTGHETL